MTWYTDPAKYQPHPREVRRRSRAFLSRLIPRTWGERYPGDVRADTGRAHRRASWPARYARSDRPTIQ